MPWAAELILECVVLVEWDQVGGGDEGWPAAPPVLVLVIAVVPHGRQSDGRPWGPWGNQWTDNAITSEKQEFGRCLHDDPTGIWFGDTTILSLLQNVKARQRKGAGHRGGEWWRVKKSEEE